MDSYGCKRHTVSRIIIRYIVRNGDIFGLLHVNTFQMDWKPKYFFGAQLIRGNLMDVQINSRRKGKINERFFFQRKESVSLLHQNGFLLGFPTNQRDITNQSNHQSMNVSIFQLAILAQCLNGNICRMSFARRFNASDRKIKTLSKDFHIAWGSSPNYRQKSPRSNWHERIHLMSPFNAQTFESQPQQAPKTNQ